MDFSKNSGFPPKSSIKKWGFPLFSPSILGPPAIFGFTPIHPGRLRWNLQNTHFERKMIWTKPPWGHVPAVNLPGCISITWEVHPKPCTLVPSNWLCLWLVSTSSFFRQPNSPGPLSDVWCGGGRFPPKNQDMFGGRLEIATYPYGSNHLLRWWLGCIITCLERYLGSITILRRWLDP